MAPAQTRKRKQEHPATTAAAPKRLRSGAASTRTRSLRGGDAASRTISSAVSSSSRSSQLSRNSPLASSSIAEEAEPEASADTISEMPISESEVDQEQAEPSKKVLGRKRALSVRGSKTGLSEQWKNAARQPSQVEMQADETMDDFHHSNVRSGAANEKTVRPFLSLPRELRDQIYRELYVHDKAIAIRQPKFHLPVLAYPSKALALARANKQIYTEAMAIYIAENDFILDLNILTAIDFLAAMPTALAAHFQSITLGKAIMSGYVRYELGMFDSSRLRTDLVKRLVYEFNLKSISIEVPDEHNPNAQNNANGGTVLNPGGGAAAQAGAGANTWFNLSTFHPRHDYSWSLMRELVDVLLESGFDQLRLVYATPIHFDIKDDPKKLLNLYAISRILYLDDEFEVETQVKRIEQARMAGRRDEFADRKAVERYVRRTRQIRHFRVGEGSKRRWEEGSIVELKRHQTPEDKKEPGLHDVKMLMDMPGAEPLDTLVL